MVEPLEFGVMLPQAGARWSQVLRFAQQAEQLGYDFVWVVDHLQAAPVEAGILEAWTVLSAVGSATSRIGLAVQVACQSFRPPALLAKMAATLDLVSGGRLQLLLGAGWDETEYRAFGYPFPSPAVRLAQLADAIRIVKGMCRGGTETFTYRGAHYTVCEARNLPPPERRLPVGIGGGGDRLLELAAVEADEWNCPPGLLCRFEERAGLLDQFLARTPGRRVCRSAQIALHAGSPGAVLDGLDPAQRALAVTGDEEEMRARAMRLSELGIGRVYGWVTSRAQLEAVAERLPALRSFPGAT